MPRYMIHACPNRLWYVNDFLIPSMIKQGIKRKDIKIYCDENGDGNLVSWLKSCEQVDCDTWHLQDDILISSDFGKITKHDYKTIVCGFSSRVDKNHGSGLLHVSSMWYSFQCIYIPKRYTDEFITWFEKHKDSNAKVQEKVKRNKGDDAVFMRYMWNARPYDFVINLYPNLVEHVYYLIGGSVVNKAREKPLVSRYWEEPELIEQLELELKNYGRT